MILAALALSARAQSVPVDFDQGTRTKAVLQAAREAVAASVPMPDVAVSRGADGGLFLYGADCGSLQEQVSALASWKARLGETPSAAPACRCDGGSCSVAVDGVVPETVDALHGLRAGRWGPNCWNAALVSAKILPVARFSPPEEMTFWMGSPLCRELAGAEEPRPGDIVAIRDKAAAEVHGFVYISDELAFSKNYLTTVAPYALQSPEEVFGEFPVAAPCRKLAGSSSPDCPAYANVFRCRSLGEYVVSLGRALSREYVSADSEVLAAEREVSALEFGWKSDPALRARGPEILAAIVSRLPALRTRVEAEMKAPAVPEGERLLWSGLLHRIDGIQASIAWF
ncbi:MAG: hypothetical protein NTX64_12200 [Elusimicrobia bacterium]|nr:hypothetical protein [Elusimicrobiota bacterium]